MLMLVAKSWSLQSGIQVIPNACSCAWPFSIYLLFCSNCHLFYYTQRLACVCSYVHMVKQLYLLFSQIVKCQVKFYWPKKLLLWEQCVQMHSPDDEPCTVWKHNCNKNKLPTIILFWRRWWRLITGYDFGLLHTYISKCGVRGISICIQRHPLSLTFWPEYWYGLLLHHPLYHFAWPSDQNIGF